MSILSISRRYVLDLPIIICTPHLCTYTNVFSRSTNNCNANVVCPTPCETATDLVTHIFFNTFQGDGSNDNNTFWIFHSLEFRVFRKEIYFTPVYHQHERRIFPYVCFPVNTTRLVSGYVIIILLLSWLLSLLSLLLLYYALEGRLGRVGDSRRELSWLKPRLTRTRCRHNSW